VTHRPLSLAVIDLDGLQNLSCESQEGVFGGVFWNIAEACRAASDAGAFCSRVSDGQLAVLVPVGDAVDARHIANQICREIECIALPFDRFHTSVRAASLDPTEDGGLAAVTLLEQLCSDEPYLEPTQDAALDYPVDEDSLPVHFASEETVILDIGRLQ
jgi:GGDEF domain-containing protein